MRLIWISDDITWSTGFGLQSKQVLYRLKAARPDWDLAAYHWADPGVPFFNANGILMLPRPKGNQNYDGNIQWYIENFDPDFIVTLHDIFYCAPWMSKYSNASSYSRTRWINWFVYDMVSGTAPKHWRTFFKAMDAPVAISKYAQEDVKKHFGITPYRISHGVDKAEFPPISKERLEQRRQKIGNPDFIMGAFCRNTFRKQPILLLEAWQKIQKEYPHAKLLLRMQLQDWQGYDMATYFNHFGVTKSVLVSQSVNPTLGQSQDELNMLFQLSDAQVLPTMGEGFGIPIIEGYAVKGLPVIMTRCTSYDELVGDHGLPIEAATHVWTTSAGAQVLPDVKSLTEQMRIMIDDAKLRTKFRQVNERFWQQYDFDRVVIPEWIELLEKLEATKIKHNRFRRRPKQDRKLKRSN